MTSYYGAPHPSAATEHTEEPQLAGYVCTRNTSTATEHADDTAIPDILFTIDDASQIRRTFKGQPGVLHTEARRHLNEITDIAGQDGADDVYYIDDSIRWKEYT